MLLRPNKLKSKPHPNPPLEKKGRESAFPPSVPMGKRSLPPYMPLTAWDLCIRVSYYARALAIPPQTILAPKDATQELQPESVLLRLDSDFYYSHLIV